MRLSERLCESGPSEWEFHDIHTHTDCCKTHAALAMAAAANTLNPRFRLCSRGSIRLFFSFYRHRS